MKKNHTPHTCQAVVVTCMDFRLQKFINSWTGKNIKGKFDRIAYAGGVKNITTIQDQITLSVKLHKVKEAHLINHEDCGAYGKAGNLQTHMKDLLFAKKVIKGKFPRLKVTLYYLHLNGTFKIVS